MRITKLRWDAAKQRTTPILRPGQNRPERAMSKTSPATSGPHTLTALKDPELPDAAPHPAGPADVSMPLPWGTVDLNLLPVFDALMHERNLTRAGRQLGLSQPATSHALARLRVMLKDELFVRTPEGMLPTPRAEQMAESVRDALNILRVALNPDPDAFDASTATNVFTLVVNNYAGRAIVPLLAQYVAERAPGVRLDVEPVDWSDPLDQLDHGKDLALTTLVDGGERLRCVHVLEDDYVVILGRNNPVCCEPMLTLDHLARIQHVVVSANGEDTGFIDDALSQHGLQRDIAVRIPFATLALMLVGSDRLAILPRRVAIGLASVCELEVRDLPLPSPRIGTAMIWHRRLEKHPAHVWLRRAVRECLSSRVSAPRTARARAA
jgi:DNA-binding transcriptional LysR family regulator